MNHPPPYDLVIGLDRSDKKADLHLITTATGQRRAVVIDTAPEALGAGLRCGLAAAAHRTDLTGKTGPGDEPPPKPTNPPPRTE
jgi:hypothetical protein